MINLRVICVKDIIKYLVKVTLAIAILVIFTRFFYGIKKGKVVKFNNISILTYAINKAIPGLRQYVGEENVNINIEDTYKIALNSELGIAKTITTRNIEEQRTIADMQEQPIVQEQQEKQEVEQVEEKVQIVETNIPTEVINSQYNSFSTEIAGVKIKNESSYQLNEGEYNLENVSVNKNKFLIFHTHTCESYTNSEKYQYVPTGNYRTTDYNFSVVRVGDELEKYLKDFGYNVLHDKTYHDFPAYSGSYGRSLITVKNILESNKDTDIVIDIHRDAIGDNTYAPKVKIGDEIAAQLVFVIGTDGGGLQHSNWKKNFELALQVQKKADEMYPGLFKPLILRDSRYNQQVANGACIIEVGATGNTLDESLVSMKYLAKVLSEL